jgi:hypothetical protein
MDKKFNWRGLRRRNKNIMTPQELNDASRHHPGKAHLGPAPPLHHHTLAGASHPEAREAAPSLSPGATRTCCMKRATCPTANEEHNPERRDQGELMTPSRR